jgi:hypothetical protein
MNEKQLDFSAIEEPSESSQAEYLPLNGWKILEDRRTSLLPFERYYAELFLTACFPAESARAMERPAERVAWPLAPAGGGKADRKPWGENTTFIESWFEKGETLSQSETELSIDEPDRWTRALAWVRTLAAATGILPA